MGVFGAGNFDNDYALDVRDGYIKQLVDEIGELINSEDFGFEDIDSTMGLIAILIAILKHTSGSEPEPDDPKLLVFLKGMGQSSIDEETISKWRNKILQTYDEEVEEWRGSEEFTKERRKIIEETLAKLSAS